MFECFTLAFIALTVGLLLTRWQQSDEKKRQARGEETRRGDNSW